MVNVQQGIMLLCHTVAEVTNRVGLHNTRSTQALKGFLSLPNNGTAALPLPSSQQYSPPASVSGASGSVAGLNLLLEDSSSGSGGDIDASVQALDDASSSRKRSQSEPIGLNSAGRPAAAEATTRGLGGPPSFPKGAIAATQPAGSMFWGIGRK